MISAWWPGPLIAALATVGIAGIVGWMVGPHRLIGLLSMAVAWVLGTVLLLALAVAIFAGLTRYW